MVKEVLPLLVVEDGLMNGIGVIDDPDVAMENIRYNLCGKTPDIMIVNNAARAGYIYFTAKGHPMQSAEQTPDAKYKVVSIGYHGIYGFPLFAMFTRKYDGYWGGICVNTMPKLIERMRKMFNSNNRKLEFFDTIDQLLYSKDFELVGNGYKAVKDYNSNIVADMEDKSEFYEELKSQLHDSKSWTIKTLTGYMRELLIKIEYEKKMYPEKLNGFLMSSNRKTCLVNTGLLNKYNLDIYIVDTNSKIGFVDQKTLKVVHSKPELIDYGFSKEEIATMPKAVQFFKSIDELLFHCTAADLDLNNYYLEHILEERRNRFPECYAKEPVDSLCFKLRAALETAVHIAERDYRYAVPMFNLNDNKIQHLLPIYLSGDLSAKPDFAAVIDFKSGFYFPVTIIDLETAYNDARLICRPDSSWLA